MADFNITINSKAVFYVNDLERNTTDCASIFNYEIFSTNGDILNISVLGEPVNLRFRLNGIIYPFATSVLGLVYNNTLELDFILVNSGSAGTFNDAKVFITNITTGDSYLDTVNRADDSTPCPISPFSTGLTVDSTLITVDSTLITADNG